MKALLPLSVAGFVVSILSGCSDTLSTKIATRQTAWSSSQDLSDSKIKFDWPMKSNGLLDVDRPPLFSCFEQLDRPEPQTPAAIPGYDFSVFEPELRDMIANCFADEPPELKTLLSISPEDVRGRLAFDLNARGTGVVTVGERLKMWSVARAESIGDGFELPSDSISTVLMDRNAQHAIVADEQSLYRISLKDGAIVNEIESPGGAIVSWDRAKKSDVIAGITDAGDLFLVRDDLSDLSVHETGIFEEKTQVAISPKGTDIVLRAGTSCLLYRVADGQIADAATISGQYDPEATVSAGINSMLWAGPTNFVRTQLLSLQHEQLEEGESLPEVINPWWTYTTWKILLSDIAVMTDDSMSWFLVAAERENEGKTEFVLAEMIGYGYDSGRPRVLDGTRPLAMTFGNAARTVAVLQEEGLRVFDCGPRDCSGTSLIQTLAAELANKGHFDQFETLCNYLGDYPRTLRGHSGPAQQGYCVFDLADTWATMIVRQRSGESGEDDERLLSQLEQWLESGSLLARLTSAARYKSLGFKVRETDNDTSDQEFATALEQLEPILALPDFPNFAFHCRCQTELGLRLPTTDFEPTLEKLLRRDPHYMPLHLNLTYRLLPRAGGSGAEPGWYADSVADFVGGDAGDILYSRIGISAMPSYRTYENPFKYVPFDVDRILRGARLRIQQDICSSHELLLYGSVGFIRNERGFVKEILRHHRTHVPLVDRQRDDPGYLRLGYYADETP